MNSDLVVREVDWNARRTDLHAIRRAVFIEEQHVPEELEWDEADAHCRHVLAFSPEGEAVGTGRLLPDGHIGRMAVMKPWRGRGVGAALLRRLIDAARERGDREVLLSAQVHALGFYRAQGFAAYGEVYDDAGIPHQSMRLKLG